MTPHDCMERLLYEEERPIGMLGPYAVTEAACADCGERWGVIYGTPGYPSPFDVITRKLEAIEAAREAVQ